MRLCLVGLSLLFVAVSIANAGPRSSACHIHPPGSTPQKPIKIIGPFASLADCETERRRRFPGAGRCHCRADFTPLWYPADPTVDRQSEPYELL